LPSYLLLRLPTPRPATAPIIIAFDGTIKHIEIVL